MPSPALDGPGRGYDGRMISVIICSVSGTKFAAMSAHFRELFGDEPHEIIGVHDATSMCQGYNRGFAQSKGEIVVFAHDDIEILSRDFAQCVKTHMEKWDVIGVAGTDRLVGANWAMAGPPYLFGQVAQLGEPGRGPKGGPDILVGIFGVHRRVVGGIQGMDGLFLAFRREAVEKLGGWDEKTFTGWHGYDVDMVFRAQLAGLRVAVVNDVAILHASEGDFGKAWQESAQLFLRKHAANLPLWRARWGRTAGVGVQTREEALEVMTAWKWEE